MSLRSRIIGISILIFSCAIFSPAYAADEAQLGVALSLPIISKDPSHLHGYRGSIWYQPASLIWPQWNIYFEASAGHWWLNQATPHRQINIIAIAPVIRFYFIHTDLISPFVELSVGPSYLSQTRLENRNLGMHFAFQDQIGVGSTFGKEKRLAISLAALHYSNGSLCAMNAGITIPVLLNISYRFN